MPLFPSIVQNGFVVDDLEAALRHWIGDLGIGPFFLADHVEVARYVWQGVESSIDLTLAFAFASDVQIELIYQHDDAPSSFRHHLATKGPGFHHVCHRTMEFDKVYQAALARGLKIDSEGEILGGARFCYFDSGKIGLPLMEIVSLSERGIAMHARIHEASVDWDGADPVRSLKLGSE